MPRIKKQHLKQRADGRYCCKYHGMQFMGNSEDEALAARDEYKRREAAGETRQEQHFFRDYAIEWVESYKGHLTTGPYNTHIRNLNKFMGLCGNKSMQDYRPTDISKFYQAFACMSSSTIHSARDTIKGVFKAAYADGIIKKDPTEAITPPKGTKGTHRAITQEERQLIHSVDHRLRPAVMVMLYAGLRKGEAMALDIDRDVNFTNRTLTVHQAIRFDTNGQPIICEPKTEAGTRTIPLLDVLSAELAGKHGLLCPSATGGHMSQSSWKRAWESYLYALGEARNGCSRRWAKGPWKPVSIRAHDLRHSFCTMLYDAGVDLKSAMLWMGHADQTMTMQIYTHLSDKRRTEAENALRNAEKQAFGMQNGMQKRFVSCETLEK